MGVITQYMVGLAHGYKVLMQTDMFESILWVVVLFQ